MNTACGHCQRCIDTNPNKPPTPIAEGVKAAVAAMTQEECENWIMMKGQNKERWFEVRILDPEVGQDPTMIALMESVSDMIMNGINGMPFLEGEKDRAEKAQLKKDNPLIIVP